MLKSNWFNFLILKLNNSFYRCAARIGQINSAIILFTTINIVIIIVLFCYLCTIKKIRNQTPESLASPLSIQSIRNNQVSSYVRTIVPNQYSEIERKATKKILSYITMFMLQWVPMLISQIARFYNVSYSINLEKNFLLHGFLFIYVKILV